MGLVSPVRAGLLLVLACAAAGLPAADVGARPKKDKIPELLVPPMPPMPDVGLGARLVARAAAYEDYMHRASLISPAFADGAGVAQSLQAGAAYEPVQFLRGEIAYAAIAALQDPTFIASVRAAGGTPGERYAVLKQIYADPANAFAFKGADAAAGLAREALVGDGMTLFSSGRVIRQAAYDIQRQPWSLEDVTDREARLEAVKTRSRLPMPVSPDETGTLQRAISGQAALGLAPDPLAPPYPRLIVRAVALAALAAIGEAGDDHVDDLSWLLDDYFTAHCLAQAKLALNECLAVARPNYEDVFCLGQHALNDTGACVVNGVGGTVPLEISTTPIPIPRVHSARHHGRRKS